MASVPTPSVAVSATSASVPSWTGDPIVWLAQMNAFFVANKIAAHHMQYSFIISSLPPALIMEVKDIITSPPGTYTCDQLKCEIIKRTSVSQQERLRQLLTAEELGDRKPSQLLRRMRSLLGANTLEDSILKQLFLSRLPRNTQVVLASAKDRENIEHLAELADNIAEVYAPAPTLASVSNPSIPLATQPLISDPVAALLKQQTLIIQSLVEKVERLHLSGRSPGRSRNFSQRSRSRSPSASRRNNRYCWYHNKFGHKAHHCIPLCDFNRAKSSTENAFSPSENQQGGI